jgi:hypothetical protein
MNWSGLRSRDSSNPLGVVQESCSISPTTSCHREPLEVLLECFEDRLRIQGHASGVIERLARFSYRNVSTASSNNIEGMDGSRPGIFVPMYHPSTLSRRLRLCSELIVFFHSCSTSSSALMRVLPCSRILLRTPMIHSSCFSTMLGPEICLY